MVVGDRNLSWTKCFYFQEFSTTSAVFSIPSSTPCCPRDTGELSWISRGILTAGLPTAYQRRRLRHSEMPSWSPLDVLQSSHWSRSIEAWLWLVLMSCLVLLRLLSHKNTAQGTQKHLSTRYFSTQVLQRHFLPFTLCLYGIRVASMHLLGLSVDHSVLCC